MVRTTVALGPFSSARVNLAKSTFNRIFLILLAVVALIFIVTGLVIEAKQFSP